MNHIKSSSNIDAIKEVRKPFNELISNLSNNETKKIRRKLYKKEGASRFFKEKEQDGTLTNRQKNVVRNIARYVKNINIYLKNFGKHLNKLQKHEYGLDYLFDDHNEKPTNAFKDARHLLNEYRTNLLVKDIDDIRKKL